MDKRIADKLGSEIQAALDVVAKRHGLNVNVKGGTFDSTLGLFKPRIEFTEGDTEEKMYRKFAPMFGINPDSFGASFRSTSGMMTISGFNPNAGRMPILARGENGKTYKFPVEQVIKMLPSAARPVHLTETTGLLQAKS